MGESDIEDHVMPREKVTEVSLAAAVVNPSFSIPCSSGVLCPSSI
jgi:hypothetical protein